MPTWIWIIITIVIVVFICYLLHKAVNHDIEKFADKVVRNAVKKPKPILTGGPYSFSEMYTSEDDELQIPLDHLKWLTIWGEPRHGEYKLYWSSSILEHHYRKRLPNSVVLPIERDSITFAIDVAMDDDELKQFTTNRKYEQIFLTVYDSSDKILATFKIVIYYDQALYLRNNPSFA